MQYTDLKFGVFLAPIHAHEDDHGQTLQQEMALLAYLDELGYDRVWLGEDDAAGRSALASFESIVTGLAESTKHITIGIGLSCGSDQQPLVLAERIMQLDRLTDGRVAFSIGPGAPAAHASKPWITPEHQHQLMTDTLEVLVALLKGETVTRNTRWFELDEACLPVPHSTRPLVPMSVTAQVSPISARLAGVHGLGLLSLAATSAGGFNALPVNWEIYARKAKENEQTIDRRDWSLAGPIHIADTRDQAIDNVSHGLNEWVNYYRDVVGLPVAPSGASTDIAQALNDSGLAVIGSPQDAVRQIRRLQEQSGGFGCFLQLAHRWADWEQTRKSYRLFAEQVMPEFQ